MQPRRRSGRPCDCSARSRPNCWASEIRPGTDEQVTATSALAFAELGGIGPAAGLLRFTSMSQPDVPLHLLLRPPQLMLRVRRGGGAAAGSTAGRRPRRDQQWPGSATRSISAPYDGRVSVYRLVQAITLNQLPSDTADAWRQAARAVIEAALPGDPQDPAAWPMFAALLPHAQEALTPASDGMSRCADYLGHAGNDEPAAQDLQQQVLRARRPVWGPSILTRSSPAATWPAGPGRREMRPRPATRSPRCCPSWNGSSARPDHPHRPRLPGPVDRGGRDAAAARDQFAALLPIVQRVLGTDRRKPSSPAATSPDGPRRREMRPRPATSSPRCYRSWNEPPAPSTRTR